MKCKKCGLNEIVKYSKCQCLKCSLKYNKEYRAKNKDKVYKWNKKARDKNFAIDGYREKKIANDKRLLTKKRREVMEFLGGIKCNNCGFDDYRVLQIDHINSDGHKENKIRENRYKYFKKIQSEPERYQVLCANCNWIKKHDKKEH